MSPIYTKDGKILTENGKVATNNKCCCNNLACCEHYCHKMCCNKIKWVVPESEDYFTTVDTNCHATLELPASSVRIRVRVRCSGYYYGTFTYGDTFYDCDTDCEIVEVEYSEDSGETWTTTPPESAAGITWSIYCPGDAEQPTADASTPRCAVATFLDAEQCEAANGEPCSRPCRDCGLPCGFEPTEWRLISDYNGDVWFSGDVIPNPLYTAEGESFCYDPCNPFFPGLSPLQPRWLLEHFPFVDSQCDRSPAGWPRTVGDWLYLEVLGCDGVNWERVKLSCGCYSSLDNGVFFTFSDATDICTFNFFFWSNLGAPTLGDRNTGESKIYQSPPGCACLRDPATGEKITNTSGASICCPQCNQYLGATGCSTGLEYLGHGEAVRFTGAVDNEGSNLWNWEDSQGRSPAGFWPGGAITIAGELLSWREGGGSSPRNYGNLSYPSVTLEPGSKLAISLTTAMLTVDDAVIETYPYVAGVSSPGASCANGGQPTVQITVTGTATFINGAVNNAEKIIGNCDFTDSENNGTIMGNCTFSGSATHNGTVDGDATFSGTASMAGDVTGTATFTGSSCYTSGTAGTFVPDPPPAC